MSLYLQRFKFGDMVLEVNAQCIDFPEGPSPFYSPFRTQHKTDIKITAHRTKTLPKPIPAKQATFKANFQGHPIWVLFDLKDHYRIEMFDNQTDKRNRVAVISRDFSNVELYVQKFNWNYQALLRPLTEILTVNYLAPRDGLLLHSAAIRDHEQGYAFIGHSGNGKTTTTHLWKFKEGDYSILGDERTIIRKVDGTWYVYGTPWSGIGMIVESCKVPLTHVFLIRHGKKNEMVEAPKMILFQEVFQEVFSSFWSSEKLDQISGTCEKLISEVPTFQFPFLKEEATTDFVREFTRGKALNL